MLNHNIKIKICGLTRNEDIEAVNELLPDYIGFVFWERSKRNVSKEKAAVLKKLLNPEIKAVGVFVDADIDFVAGLLNEGIIDIAQLHGNEDDAYIEKLRLRVSEMSGGSKLTEIIKAFNIDRPEPFEEVENSKADHIMIDPGKGSGVTFDWSKLEGLERPYFLAGGLNPDNVQEVVRKIEPYAVDVSSGVETDGVKDAVKMKVFVEAVRTAFSSC